MRTLLVVGLALLLTGCRQETLYEGKPISLWTKELKSPWPTARCRAAAALGAIGPKAKAAIPDLTEALKDPEPIVRWAAAESLGYFGSEARVAVPALREIAETDPNIAARDAAAHSLEQIDSGANAAKGR